jgi:branched-chain amino acid transport system permease protein
MSAETIVNGLLVGGVYGTVAIGLSLVFGVMRLVNLAHGDLLVFGAFVAYAVVAELHIDPLLSTLIVVPIVALLAYPLQRYLLNALLVRGMEPPLVATFGLSLVIQALLLRFFSGDPKSLAAPYGNVGIVIAGMHVRAIYLIGSLIGIAIVAALLLLLRRTRFGIALRAAAADPQTSGTFGVDVAHVYATTFAIAAGIAAMGGILLGIAFSFTPTSGILYLLKAFTIVVLGGLGSMTATLAVGVTLGGLESVFASLFGGAYRDFCIYLLFIVVLAVRPQGLFGRSR